MEETLKNALPISLIPILMTLGLSFLIGLEREEHAGRRTYNFGGVRTFPLIGLCGYLTAKLTENQPAIIGVGILVFGALFWLSYRKKLQTSASPGLTSEVSGLFTYLLGALIFHGSLWEATTLTVLVLLLLELKTGLETLARKIPAEEIFTFTRFLLISAVILPIVPNQEFTALHFNPFHLWIIVVAISALSYGAYVLGRILGAGRGLALTALLGGMYSSTSTTVVLAKRSKEEKTDPLFSGAIVIASGIMYFRLVVLLAIFNGDLSREIALPFIGLGLLFCAVGGIWMRIEKKKGRHAHSIEVHGANPLELKSAFIFAALFSVMGILTAFAIEYLGSAGMYALSFVTGLTDVDPFVMSLTQSAGAVVTLHTAAQGIVIAAASNNVMKGIYAFIWGGNNVRKQGSSVLIILAIVSLLALIFV